MSLKFKIFAISFVVVLFVTGGLLRFLALYSDKN